VEKYADMKTFVEALRDWERGKHFRDNVQDIVH
jgi:hypothetical protein